MVVSEMKPSEHVLYITLIDFLLQLLFLGLVITVIYIDQAPDINELQITKNEVEKIKKNTGVSDLTELTDLLTRLGPLDKVANNANIGHILKDAVDKVGGNEKALHALKNFNIEQDLSSTFNKVGGKEEALKILNMAAKKGQGLPPCLPKGVKLANFHTYIDHIEIQQPLSVEMVSLLKTLGVSDGLVTNLSLGEFSKLFSPLSARNFKEQCIFNVTVTEHVYDTRPRDVIRKSFLAEPRPADDIR